MKRSILLCIFVLFVAVEIFATPVNVETVKKVAINWIVERSDFSKDEIEVNRVLIEKEKEKNAIYVCKLNPRGFVIISADDIANPIIAYSKEDIYTDFNQPPAFIDMINNAKKEIYFAINNQITPFNKTIQEWNRLKIAIDDFIPEPIERNVDPLINTYWGQCGGYNTLCPLDPNSACGNGHVPAGCVATAMAQILRYHCYPISGNGNHNYNHPDYGQQSADFENTIYQYESMPLNISGINDDDIATLVYHCGVSVDMNYGPQGSGATSPATINALTTYFNYSGAISLENKADYTNNIWINMMKNELDNNRPIIYTGRNPDNTSGHAFLLDGYQDNNSFHINWGWNGAFQGTYFILDDLTPGDDNYNLNQQAIINIFPDETNYGSNQTPETATFVNMPYYELHAIMPAGDVDWYKMYLPSGSSVNLFTELEGSSELDPKAWLFGPCSEEGFELLSNPNSYLVEADDDDHGNLQPEINTDITESGYYYLRIAYYENSPIRDYRRSETGTYYLTINSTSPGEPDLYLNLMYVPDYVPHEGGNFTLIVGNAGDGTLYWDSQNVPTWITLNPSNGSTQNTQNVNVNVSQNNTDDGRSCTMNFYNINNPSDHTWLTIDQLGPGTYIYNEYVSGVWDISGSPYIVCEDVEVQEDEELIIEAGVVVKFQPGCNLFIRGILKVDGTSNNRVTFCSEGESNHNVDLTIYSEDHHEECYIKYADFINEALELRGSSLIKGCNFRDRENYGTHGSEVLIIDPDTGNYPEIIDCIFEDNDVEKLIYIYGTSMPYFENCIFQNNSNTDEEWGLIEVDDNSIPSFMECDFISNHSTGDGGVFYFDEESSAYFENCFFLNNSSNGDGGVFKIASNGIFNFDRCEFKENSSSEDGGVILLNDGTLIFDTCLFADNISTEDSGVIDCYSYDGQSWFINCVFDENSAGDEGNICYSASDIIFTNCIILEEDDIFDGGNPDCYYSVIPNGSGSYMHEGCTTDDPDLDDNYYPNEGSVCIDSGTQDESFLPPDFYFSEFDFAGNPRIYNGIIDIGIYETTYTSIEDNSVLPNITMLYQNAPNPFNPSTTIFYSLSENINNPTIEIYNLKGQKVKSFKLLEKTGENFITWNGKDENETTISSGIYFYRLLNQNKTIITRKMLMLK